MRFFCEILLGFFLGLLCSDSVQAQDNRGVSALGMCSPRYDYANMMTSFKYASVIRTKFLDNTFNPNGCKNLELLMREPKPLDMMSVILNGPGLRNGRLEKHEIHFGHSVSSLNRAVLNKEPKFMAKFDSRLNKIAAILNTRTGALTHRVNVCLECDLSQPARRILMERAKLVFPTAIYIDNPMQGACIPGLICEKHGSTANPPKPKSVDLDGEDYDGIKARQWGLRHADAETVYAWKLCNNGFKKHEDWKPPTQRTNFCGNRDNKDFGYWTRPEALIVGLAGNETDKKGCKRYYPASDGNRKDFTWKLGDGRPYAVSLFPRAFRAQFNKVVVRRDGLTDTGRYRGRYTEDGTNRLIYDFGKHTADQRDSSVLFADGNCWLLDKPQFRLD